MESEAHTIALQKHIEVMNREPADTMYLEVLVLNTSTPKLTVNKSTGRITLKVSDKSSEHIKGKLIELAEKVMMRGDLPSVTLRGMIKYHESKFEVQLLSESKKFKISEEVTDV